MGCVADVGVYLTNCEPDAGSKLIKQTKRIHRVPFDMYLKRLYYCNNNEKRNHCSLAGVVSWIVLEFHTSGDLVSHVTAC